MLLDDERLCCQFVVRLSRLSLTKLTNLFVAHDDLVHLQAVFRVLPRAVLGVGLFTATATTASAAGATSTDDKNLHRRLRAEKSDFPGFFSRLAGLFKHEHGLEVQVGIICIESFHISCLAGISYHVVLCRRRDKTDRTI